MAALGSDKIRLSDVQRALGYFPNSVAALCKYTGVNKWSRYKPFRSTAVDYAGMSLLQEGLRQANYGLSWTGGATEDSFVHERPQGGKASPCRLGDFRQYSHYQEHMIGVRSPEIDITLDNFDGYTPVSPLSGVPNGIGLLDLKQLFIGKGVPYLYFQLHLPKSGGTYVPDVNVLLGRINLNDTAQNLLMSNRMMCKFGRTDDGAGTIYAFLSDDPDLTTILSPTPGFTFQKAGVYDPQFTVGDIASGYEWNGTGAASSSSLRIGTGPTYDETNTFEYFSAVEYGSPRYLDLSNAQRLYILPGVVYGTSNTPINRDNVYLRITDWLRRKEWYVTLGSGSDLGGWEVTSGTSGLWLGQSLEYFAKFTTGFCGFSLVYDTGEAGYNCIPLTKELFCRVIWPDSLQEPMNIFDEDGPVIG